MKATWKRAIICLVLCAALLLGNVPVTGFTASTSHSHPVCGSSCVCTSDTHVNANWEPWDGTTKLYGGYYYLTQDVVLNSTMILDYDYVTNLCLNGHSITSEKMVFDIYSYRTLLITDCVGTGKVETTGAWGTIGNNKSLTVWGGNIINSNSAGSTIHAYTGNTTIAGGKVQSMDGVAIYAYPGSNIHVMGGTVQGGGYSDAIVGYDETGSALGSVKISGGYLTVDTTNGVHDVISVQNGNFTMTGGYVDGPVSIMDSDGTTKISGGTINGSLDSVSKTISITGGDVKGDWFGAYLGGDANISAGTFARNSRLMGANNVVTGGDFTASDILYIEGQTWISGGSFALLSVDDAPLYLSGEPVIEKVYVGYPKTVSAQNPDGTDSYSGDVIDVSLNTDTTTWKNGDIVIKNVTSDAVAERFNLVNADPEWMYLERSGNNLVLRVLPHGACGENLSWKFLDGKLTIYGTGDMENFGMSVYQPWTDLAVAEVEIRSGVTSIGGSAFAYLPELSRVVIPEGVTTIGNFAFEGSENMEVWIPSSVTYLGCGLFTNTATAPGTVHYDGCIHQWEAIEKNILFTEDFELICLPNTNSNGPCSVCGYVEESEDLPANYDWTLTADVLYTTVGETVRLEALGNDNEPVKGVYCEWYLDRPDLAQLSGNGYWATLYPREPGKVKVTLATALGDKTVEIVIEEPLGDPANPPIALGDNNLIGAWSTVEATFTPPCGSGEYVFFVEGENYKWSIGFDHGVDIVPHRTYSAYGYRMQLQDGITYNVQIQNDSGEELRLRMMSISPDAPEISFPADTQSHAYIGDEWGFPVLPIPPDGKLGNTIAWSVDNPDVVQMTAEDDHVTLKFLSAGVVTLTAVDVDHNKSASHTITVYDGQGGGSYGPAIEFYGNGGMFEVTNGGETWPTDSYGLPVPAGESLGDYVENISDPVFWNSDRAFTKWMACTHEYIYNDEGEQVGEDNLQIPGSSLMTTAEALRYPARADGKTVIMVAQWEGDEFDYYSNVGFEVFGGTLIVDPQGDEAPFETPAPGGRCREDGTTIGEQLWFTIPNPPTHEKYTFEGWLQYNEDTGELISETPLTFAQIQAKIVPHYNVRFIAKWSGIPMDAYQDLYNQGGDSGEGNETGIQIIAFEIEQDASFTVYKDNAVLESKRHDFFVDLQQGETLAGEGYSISDITFWNPSRAFLGWDAYIFEGEQGRQKINDNILSTTQMLNYPALDGQRIYFYGQWAGEDADYYTDVVFDGFGGTYKVHCGQFTFTLSAQNGKWEWCYCRPGGTIAYECGRQRGGDVRITDLAKAGNEFFGWIEYTVANGQYQMVSTIPLTTEEVLTKTVTGDDKVFVAFWNNASWDEYLNYDGSNNSGEGGGDFGEGGEEAPINVSVSGGECGRFYVEKNGQQYNGLSGTAWLHVPTGSTLSNEGYRFVDWELYPHYAGESHTRIGWYVGTWVDDNGNFEKLPGSGLLSDTEMLNYPIPADMEIVFMAQWDAEDSGDEGQTPADGYTAGITSPGEITLDDNLLALVRVSHSEDTHFAAGEIVVGYDSSILTFNEGASDLGAATVKDTGNAIILEDYGADKDFANTRYILAFTPKSLGTVTVSLESAAFVNKENAVKSDLISATLDPAAAEVVIREPLCNVFLSDIFVGPATVEKGQSYTFYAADYEHYVYDSVTAEIDGVAVPVIDNQDGSYTVHNVTGTLTVTGSCTGRGYMVVFDGNGAEDVTDGASTAVYGVDYSFTIPSEEHFTYAVKSVVIGGKEFTGFRITDGVCTIPGGAIVGTIEITIEKIQADLSVTVEGDAAGVAAGYVPYAERNKDYVLTIVPENGYTYKVTATMGGQPVDVINNGDNTYTVEKVTGDLVFTITKTVVVDGVFFTQYLKVNHTNVWLIQYTGDVAQGKVPTYDGNNMYWSDDYQAYCYLVIAEVLLEDDVKAKIGITDGEAEVIANTMDVNGSGRVDASDAQLVYNMYNAMYTEFGGDVTAEKFFYADVNKDGQINVQDAAAIIHQILN